MIVQADDHDRRLETYLEDSVALYSCLFRQWNRVGEKVIGEQNCSCRGLFGLFEQEIDCHISVIVIFVDLSIGFRFVVVLLLLLGNIFCRFQFTVVRSRPIALTEMVQQQAFRIALIGQGRGHRRCRMSEINSLVTQTIIEGAFVHEHITLLSEWNDIGRIGTVAKNDHPTAWTGRTDVIRWRQNSSVVQRHVLARFQTRTERTWFNAGLLQLLNVELARKIIFHDDVTRRNMEATTETTGNVDLPVGRHSMFDRYGVDRTIVIVGYQMVPSVVLNRHSLASFVDDRFLRHGFDDTLLDAIVRIRNQFDDLIFERQVRVRQSEGCFDELLQAHRTTEKQRLSRWRGRERAQQTGQTEEMITV